MGEAVQSALRSATTAQDLLSCHREMSFRAMYSVLGDAQAQERIRTASPMAIHCHFLKQNPNACCSLPEAFPDAGIDVGDVCPNNPYFKPENENVLEESRVNSFLVERAIEMNRMADLGMLKPEALTPAEFELVIALDKFKAAKEHEHYEQAEYQRISRSAPPTE